MTLNHDVPQVRPAQNEVKLSEYFTLARNIKDAGAKSPIAVYLQKHSVTQWEGPRWGDLTEDLKPHISESVGSDFLIGPTAQYLWFGSETTRAPLHFDMEENLHVITAGRKHFTMFHPSQSRQVYYDAGTSFRSLHLLYIFSKNPDGSRKLDPFSGAFDQIPPALIPKEALPDFSPVDIRDPGVLEKFPAFGDAKPLSCDVGPGETLYIPSMYWHDVTSTVDPDSGFFSGLAHFHRPFHWPGGGITDQLELPIRRSRVYRHLWPDVDEGTQVPNPLGVSLAARKVRAEARERHLSQQNKQCINKAELKL